MNPYSLMLSILVASLIIALSGPASAQVANFYATTNSGLVAQTGLVVQTSGGAYICSVGACDLPACPVNYQMECFMEFDTSALAGTVISSADINIHSRNSNTPAGLHIVGTYVDYGTLGPEDYDGQWWSAPTVGGSISFTQANMGPSWTWFTNILVSNLGNINNAAGGTRTRLRLEAYSGNMPAPPDSDNDFNTAQAGTESGSAAYLTITYNEYPVSTLEDPPDGSIFNDSTIIFNCSATDSDGLSSMTLFGNWSSGWTGKGTNSMSGTADSSTFTKTISDGRYKWNCRANDTGNLKDFAASNWTFTIDTTKPSVTITKSASVLEFGVDSVDIDFAATDDHLDTMLWNITFPNGSLLDSGSGDASMTLDPGDLTVLGTYTLNIWSNDTAGNTNSTSTTFLVEDTTPPDITDIVTDPTLPLLKNASTENITVNFTSSEYPINVTFLLFYPNGTLADTQGPYELDGPGDLPLNYTVPAGLPDGNYTLNLTATDPSGNSANFTVGYIIIDGTPPALSITVNPSSIAYQGSGTVTIVMGAADPHLDSIRWSITSPYGAVLASGTANATRYMSYPQLSQSGTYTVTLWANDTLGNSNTATATFSVVHHDDEDCNSDWECGAWSSCNGGRQTRDCSCDCSHDEDCGGDGKESRVCGCQLNKDCDDGDPCTEDRCEDAVCENAPSSGASCDDGDNCTEGDICARGACKPGRYVCPVPCDKAWDCTEWSACVDGVQTRSCSCACADGQCLGDGSETFNCEGAVKKLQITKSAEELKEGEVLEIIVTDELGNPITANLVISRPQGAAIMATSPYTLIVDVNGTWEIQASKVGYLGDEDSAYVTAEKRASTAERTLFDQIISFLTSTTSAALLLALFGLLLFLLMRRRRKKRKVKKL